MRISPRNVRIAAEVLIGAKCKTRSECTCLYTDNMTATTVLTMDDFDDWLYYYERVGCPGPYHHPEYLDLLAGDFEHDLEQPELFVFEDRNELVYYPYLRRPIETVPFADTLGADLLGYDDIVSSWYWGGPIASEGVDGTMSNRFTRAFSDYSLQSGIVAEFVRFDPNIDNHEDFPELDPQHNRQTVRVDLNQSQDKIWDGFEKRNRNAIRQAKETNLVVETSTDRSDYEAFYEIYTNAMEAKNASKHYRFDFSFFERLLENDSLSTLLVARYEDDIVGGSLLVHDENIAHDFLRASNPEYWDMRVNNLICYEALLTMKRTGREIFDFQGGRPGVFKFKKGFSPDRGEFYIGKQVHMEEVYADLLEAAEEAGIETESGYFPAYRIEQSN